MSEVADAANTATVPSRRRRIALLGIVASVALAVDLVTKAWAWNNLKGVRKALVVLDPHFELAFSFNTGAAFGFLVGVSWARAFFIVVTLAALAYMAFLAWSMPTRGRYGFVAIGLVSAGAAGNLHDRLVRMDEAGRYGVVDFLKINYPWGGSWPTFNVADVLLLVGVVLLFVFVRRQDHVEEAAASAESSSPIPAGRSSGSAASP